MSVAPHDGHATSEADGNSAEHHMQRGSGADAPVVASSSMPDTLPRRQGHGIPRWYLRPMASPGAARPLAEPSPLSSPHASPPLAAVIPPPPAYPGLDSRWPGSSESNG